MGLLFRTYLKDDEYIRVGLLLSSIGDLKINGLSVWCVGHHHYLPTDNFSDYVETIISGREEHNIITKYLNDNN